eukprot:scaffold13216_cov51-Isochrysis_galbana.AAC.1
MSPPSPPPPPPPPPTSPPIPPFAPPPSAPPPQYAPGVVNKVEYNVAGIGQWGGLCSCPNGDHYRVGDNSDGCASLACIGGIAG